MRESTASSYDLRHSDGQSSSDRELKFIYSMRATLQEVGILHTLVYFHPKGYLAVFFFFYPKSLFGRICFYDEVALF